MAIDKTQEELDKEKEAAGAETAGAGTEADDKSGKEAKTFTQEEVNRMMAAEKAQGRNSVLKELGVEDTKVAKSALTNYQKILDAQKSEEEKSKDQAEANAKAAVEAQQRAEKAEAKVNAMQLGAKPDCVDDVIVLAMAKMTEGADFATIIGEIKVKYPTLFVDGTIDDEKNASKDEGNKSKKTGEKGTGGTVKTDGKEKEEQGLGARLAAARKAGSPAKSSYFSK